MTIVSLDNGTSAPRPPKHKCAVFVYGAGSGFGKSTLLGALTERLESLALSVARFPEECAPELPAFHTYVQQVRVGNGGDTATLLDGCSNFVTNLMSIDAGIIVLDSLLPCWDWLYSAGADDTTVSTFTNDINGLLSELRPVLVLVEGDLDKALARAIKDRGIDRVLEMAEYRTGERDYQSLREYFRALRLGTDRVISSWKYRVIRVDTAAYDLESSVQHITEKLAKHLPPMSSI